MKTMKMMMLMIMSLVSLSLSLCPSPCLSPSCYSSCDGGVGGRRPHDGNSPFAINMYNIYIIIHTVGIIINLISIGIDITLF